ncbi:MAG: hypothetical protein U0572_15815 [Phycisphaerales bacterium]
MSLATHDESHITCPECGWDQRHSPRVRPRWFSPWRLVPPIVVFALIVWGLDSNGGPPTTAPRAGAIPSVLVAPAITKDDVQKIVDERADGETIARFTAAMERACGRRFANPPIPLEDRSAFVAVGFVPPSGRIVETRKLGWPLPIVSSLQVRAAPDWERAATERSDVDGTSPWSPPWPGASGSLNWDIDRPFFLSYVDASAGIIVKPSAITLSTIESDWSPDDYVPNSGMSSPAGSHRVVLHLETLSIPIALLWCAWIVVGWVVVGRIRAILIGACVLALAFASIRTSTVGTVLPHSWVRATGRGQQLWRELMPLNMHRDEVRLLLGNPPGRRKLARAILTVAPIDSASDPQYLAVAVGPKWPFMVQECRTTDDFPVRTSLEVYEAGLIPPQVAALPRSDTAEMMVRDGRLVLVTRPRDQPTVTHVESDSLGWLTWIALAVFGSGAVSSRLVTAWRRSEMRDRLASKRCVKCRYPLGQIEHARIDEEPPKARVSTDGCATSASRPSVCTAVSSPKPSSPNACPECGWPQDLPIEVRPRWFSPWRVVPTTLVLSVIAWGLWSNRDGPRTRWATFGAMPEILESPPITRDALAAIADGRADDMTIESFRRAIEAMCADVSHFGERRAEPRARFVQAGFVAPATTLQEEFTIGWPIALVSGVRTRSVDDSIARIHASSPNDPEFLWLPPWPELGGSWSAAPSTIVYTTSRGEWSVSAAEIRFSESGPQPPSTPWGATPKRVASILLRSWSVPIAVLWLSWVIIGRWTRGLRRVAIVGAFVAAVVAAWALTPTFREFQIRGWLTWPPPAAQTWLELAPLDLHVSELRAALEDRTVMRATAARFVRRARVERGTGPRYLAVVVGPTWPRDSTVFRIPEYEPIVDVSWSDDTAYIPSAVSEQPGDPRTSWSFANDTLTVSCRAATASTQTVSVRIGVGWICWIGLAAAIAASLPAGTIAAMRQYRIRRRRRTGRCARCDHQLLRGVAPHRPPPVSSASHAS